MYGKLLTSTVKNLGIEVWYMFLTNFITHGACHQAFPDSAARHVLIKNKIYIQLTKFLNFI